jgi:hypothetical protein
VTAGALGAGSVAMGVAAVSMNEAITKIVFN